MGPFDQLSFSYTALLNADPLTPIQINAALVSVEMAGKVKSNAAFSFEFLKMLYLYLNFFKATFLTSAILAPALSMPIFN